MPHAANSVAPTSPPPEDEAGRLAALWRYDILDTAPEAEFEDVVRLAAQLCGAPMAAVSLVDEARQWFKAEVGLGISQTPREVSFCAHAIRQGGLVVIPDAAVHPVFHDNPLVVAGPRIRFYAGAVLLTADGHALGALCVMDRAPRPQGLSAEQGAMLQALGRQVVVQMELRRALAAERQAVERHRALAAVRAQSEAELRISEGRLQLALQAGLVGAWSWDLASGRLRGDTQIARIVGMEAEAFAEGLASTAYLDLVHPDDQPWLREALAKASAETADFTEEYRVNVGGAQRWVLSRGRFYAETDGGPATRCAGVAIDITERKTNEEALREANAGRELAMQAGRLGRFDHNPSTGRYFWDARLLAMLGLEPQVHPSLDLLFEVVHPEDRAQLQAALDRAFSPERIGAFAEDYRVVRPDTGEVRWLSALGRSAFEDGRCVRFVGVVQDVTDRKLAEAHQRLLTNELNHRVKNTLAIVQALVSRTLRDDASPQAARRAIADRLVALGRAHDILTRTSWSSAPLDEVVSSVVMGLGVEAGRVRAAGPAWRLAPKPALSLAMALHELGTNAVKYGALSNPTGWVEIEWSAGAAPAPVSTAGAPLVAADGDPPPRLRLRWLERGGPPVAPPVQEGFGSRLIGRALAQEFGGETRLDFAPTGVCWTLDAPLQAVEDPADAAALDLTP